MTTVLLVDDQALLRMGFRLVIESEPDPPRWWARPPTGA